jgi:hypothetical protein
VVPSSPPRIESASAPSLRTLKIDSFQAMPDGASVELDGRRLTKRQFLDEMQTKTNLARSRKAPATAPPTGDNTDFDSFRTQFVQKEKSRLELKKSRVVARSPQAAKAGSAAGIVSPTPDSCTSPKIELVVAEPPLEPGDTVFLNGCGFGTKNTESRLMLVGNDFPGGFLDLQIVKWLGYYIEAVVPAVTGVKDIPGAKLQIRTGDLKLSGSTPMAFRAARDVVKLTRNDVQFSCEPAADPSSKCPSYFSHTFGAMHKAASFIYSSGTDSAKVKLINGYVLAGYWWIWVAKGNGFGFVNFPNGANNGASDLNVLMSFATALAEVHYAVDLYAIGPVQVAYR